MEAHSTPKMHGSALWKSGQKGHREPAISAPFIERRELQPLVPGTRQQISQVCCNLTDTNVLISFFIRTQQASLANAASTP